jgi:hypothetical protein
MTDTQPSEAGAAEAEKPADTPPTTPEADAEDKATIEEIEQHLMDEGQWLEGQIAAETAYKNCPICAKLPDVFRTLAGALEDTMEHLDNLKEGGAKDSFIAEALRRDQAWYECAKSIALSLVEEGHHPRNVINAHPELRSLAHRKKIATKNANSKRKQKRKAARNARRRKR